MTTATITAHRAGVSSEEVGDVSTITEARAKVSREVIEDRYEGTINEPGGSWSRTGERLHRALQELYEGTPRWEWEGDLQQKDGRPGDGVVLDELYAMIREHMIRRVDELGLAR